jgi:hypothetical protein
MAGFYHGELSPCALHHLLYALAQGKPIVAEYLDFTKKKQDVSESSSKAARALSSFADNKILMTMRAQCFRLGIGFHQVNPAYSSVIGHVKFARRLFNSSERLPYCWGHIPNDKGGHVALPRLVTIAGKHVWHSWAKVKKSYQEVHAAPYQPHDYRERPEVTGEQDEIPF